ncbi:GAF domain-containing protein [Alkalicoccobacillus plakortidis]|uniref:GAF domain-containing protein n=1 Tax=Alkalicoccobacillus plakortidis TaxID=444060 RepID=A0ABT0XJB4_9BACI|nr:GAF domain-containing protein [Alkalicoccobacillus plakortidis]MCM2675299.1 GAF domain-containing protein [Alkalicoccobacillus plakortidis]
MFQSSSYSQNLAEAYTLLNKQLDALLDGETDSIANLANASALLNQFLNDVNWVGFYLTKETELILGPFQGMPACVRISFGKGVCGTAAAEQKTIRVADVHQFPGHIACDAASRSEIVVPLIKNGQTIGVLDIDSPSLDRFSDEDEKYLHQFAEILVKHL